MFISDRLFPELMQDGHIRLAQYFSFNKPDWLKFTNPIKLIEKEEPNNSNKPFMLSAWVQLGKMLLDKLEDLDFKAMFEDPSILDPGERLSKAEKLCDKEYQRINTKLDGIKKADIYKVWEGTRKAGAIRTKRYIEEFMQPKNLNPISVMHKFYKSPELASLTKEMVFLYDKITREMEVTISEAFFNQMNSLVPIIPFLTAGNRPELFGNLSRGTFLWPSLIVQTPTSH